MEVLINRPELQVSVRDTTNTVVCISCKGSGRKDVMDYHNPWALSQGGIYWIGHVVPCPACHGAGWWRDEPSLQNA